MPFFYKKIIFLAVSTLVVLGLIFALAVYPLINKIADSSQEYLSNKEILRGFDKKESLAKKLQKHLQENQNNLLRIDGALLGDEEIISFISTIEGIAAETGNAFEIKAANLSVLLDEKEPFLSLRAVIQGDFSGLVNFIANLENSPYPPYRLTEIEGLNINRLSGANLNYLNPELEEGDLETNLEIKIYTK